MVRDVLRRALAARGYTVLAAADGHAALAVAAGHDARIDLLLTDAVLPELSGRQVADRLRQRQPDLRVVFMSGYAEDLRLRRHELEAWASYLQKPFTPEQLARRVRQVLDGALPLPP